MECDSIELSNFSRFSFLIEPALRNATQCFNSQSIFDVCANFKPTFWKWVFQFASINDQWSMIKSRSIDQLVRPQVFQFHLAWIQLVDLNSKIRFLFFWLGRPYQHAAFMTKHNEKYEHDHVLKIDLNSCFRYNLSNGIHLASTKLLVTKFSSFFFLQPLIVVARCKIAFCITNRNVLNLWCLSVQWKSNPVVYFGHFYWFHFCCVVCVDGVHVSVGSVAYFMIDKFSIKTLEFRNKFLKSNVNVRPSNLFNVKP